MLYAKVQNSNNNDVRINTLIDKHDYGIVFDNKFVISMWLAHHFLYQSRLNPNLDYQNFKEMSYATKFKNIYKTMFYIAKKKTRQA